MVVMVVRIRLVVNMAKKTILAIFKFTQVFSHVFMFCLVVEIAFSLPHFVA